tara:strand:+ start:1182 stop:1997 length:816 start_codon:yes stop_codon:yes gene_type:complete
MPELPEVETTRQGLLPHVTHQTIDKVIVRNRSLRYPIESRFEAQCEQRIIQTLTRRSKYLLFELDQGYVLLHLGMSGHLRVLPIDTAAEKHDHVDILLSNKLLVRYTDPRRFGMINWFDIPYHIHPLLRKLAPEPLTPAFNSHYFYKACQTKKKVIKKVLMDSHIVVGVGNIYAQECLFLEGIHPNRKASDLSIDESKRLVKRIKQVLKKAIAKGGTTLKDFKNVDGKPGYFSQTLHVYGRNTLPCTTCQRPLDKCLIDNRSTVYCAYCQH